MASSSWRKLRYSHLPKLSGTAAGKGASRLPRCCGLGPWPNKTGVRREHDRGRSHRGSFSIHVIHVPSTHVKYVHGAPQREEGRREHGKEAGQTFQS